VRYTPIRCLIYIYTILVTKPPHSRHAVFTSSHQHIASGTDVQTEHLERGIRVPAAHEHIWNVREDQMGALWGDTLVFLLVLIH
jgi:hypothetical protein